MVKFYLQNIGTFILIFDLLLKLQAIERGSSQRLKHDTAEKIDRERYSDNIEHSEKGKLYKFIGNRGEKKRSYGQNMFGMRRGSQMQMGDRGGKPIKNYDFYDQKSDFGWFKGQGHNRYPYHSGTPSYTNDGYEEYQKPPEPNAVAHAMATLERHMSSSEALHSDNMFKHGSKEGGGQHQGLGYQINERQGDESQDESQGGSLNEGGSSETKGHDRNEGHFKDDDIHNNENGKMMEHYGWKSVQGPALLNSNKENSHGHSHDSEGEESHENEGYESHENEGHESYGNEGHESHGNTALEPHGYEGHESHRYEGNGSNGHEGHESYGNEEHESHGNEGHVSHGSTVQEPHGYEGHESSENSRISGREGWLPLTPPFQGVVSHEGGMEHNSAAHDGIHKGLDDHSPPIEQPKAKYRDEDRGVFGGTEPEPSHEEGQAAEEDHKEGNEGNYQRTQPVAEHQDNRSPSVGKTHDDYVSFPNDNAAMKENPNRNNPMHDPFLVSKPENTEMNHVERNGVKQGMAGQNVPKEQGPLNSENTIRINVGYPHYRVPETHLEAVSKAPHEGPERGGGLWGNQPGVGEQYEQKRKERQVVGASDEKKVTSEQRIEANSTSSENGASEQHGLKTQLLQVNSQGKNSMKHDPEDVRNAGKNDTGKRLAVKKIPVTITTGVYDSRELISIDENKNFIKNKENEFKIDQDLKIDKKFNSGVRVENHEIRTEVNKLGGRALKIFKPKLNQLIKNVKINKIRKDSTRKKKLELGSRFSLKRSKENEDSKEKPYAKKSKGEMRLSLRHGTGQDLGAVHGHPAISDEEAMHSSPEELLEMANGFRHRAEEYDSKAKELENQAEIQDHQHDHHGAVSQHHPGHQGPERGGNLHEGEHGEGEQYHHHQGFGPWSGPTWHGPGPFGMSQFGHNGMGGEHGGNNGGHGGGHEGGHEGEHEGGHEGGHQGGHGDNVIHFDTGYPFYHVPKPHMLPQIEYHKPAPPVHGLNPYEVLTSEQFHRPMLHAGHGNLPYGVNQRTLQSREDIYRFSDKKKTEPVVPEKTQRYGTIMRDFLNDENVASFLLK